jgi:hypothetical protein
MRFDPEPGKVFNDVALLAEAFVEVIVTVIAVTCPLDPSPDFSTVRKFKCDLCGVPPGIEVDQIGQLFSPQVPGTRKGENKKNGIDDIAFTGTIGPGYYGKPL